VYLKYTIPTEFESKKLKIEAVLNMDTQKPIEEKRYDDNTKVIEMEVKEGIDLEIVSVKYNEYPANQRVTALIEIQNNTGTVISDPKVPVKFEINWRNGDKIEKATKVKEIELPPIRLGTATVPFTFTTPNEKTSFTITGAVNYNQTYKEIDMDNNTKSITVSVAKNDTRVSKKDKTDPILKKIHISTKISQEFTIYRITTTRYADIVPATGEVKYRDELTTTEIGKKVQTKIVPLK